MVGFWGIEVKPGKQYPIEFPEEEDARLRITQATLGLGDSKGRSIVQCSVGDKSPVFLCSLLPKRNESCPLNLEFENDEEPVTFSVIGKQSVHLSGFFETYAEEEGEPVGQGYESDSYEEESSESGSENSLDDGCDDNEVDDSDLDMDQPSRATKSGVIIEQIEDEEKPTGKGQSKPLLVGTQSNGPEENTKDAGVPVLESEDEDGFPISTKNKTKSVKSDIDTKKDKGTNNKERKAKDGEFAAGLKRKVEDLDKDHQERQKKSKKKQSTGEKEKQPEVLNDKDEHGKLLANEKSPDIKMDSVPTENPTEEKKKKKKNKKKSQETEEKTNADQTDANMGNTKAKPSNVRTYPNGLIIEDVAMGRPDGKRADPGKKVSVRYIGKLKNGKQFDANVKGPPFKFTLGVGQVISGWDVGVKGMRVGDKRRLTVPPSMGYGHKGAPPQIPPNAWLVFDVELVAVN
ncbi:peptidyl-prolyl cis-trans isomerase FKBP53 [Argentina anserina]|uniref:peptidyl-prolyl cis-trans isomerase FKBP53 n=1 Tax=Argentina anserina TaxID=57926 RepID=UPI0021762D0B|nr:peptidyl-prolyl cis-trans isomerase FKBP53 [Potentilla anserina]